MNVLRELRGAAHGAAVVASGLEPLDALMVRTPFMAGLFGWPEPHPDPAPHAEAWKDTEAATDRTLARAFALLEPAERSELVELLVAAQDGAT
jgi:hypothetical protein